MVFTFIFYCLIILFVCFSYKYNTRRYNYIVVLTLGLVLGLRGCGIDIHSYIEMFRFYINNNASLFDPKYYDPYFDIRFENDMHTEWFYLITIKFVKLFSTSSVWFFILIDVLSIWAMDRFIQRFNNREKMYISYFFFTTMIFAQMFNAMRQFLALMVFMNVLDFIQRRELVKYFLSIFALYLLFHKSAILLLPLYFFIHKDLLKKIEYQFLLFICVFFLSTIFIEQLQEIMNYLFLATDTQGFLNTNYLNPEEQVNEMERGILYTLFRFTILTYIIIHSREFKDRYGSLGVILYNLTYLGLIVNELSYNRGVERLNIYFISFQFITLGLMVYNTFYGYYKKNTKMKVYSYLVLLFNFVWFLNGVVKGAAGFAPYILNPEL